MASLAKLKRRPRIGAQGDHARRDAEHGQSVATLENLRALKGPTGALGNLQSIPRDLFLAGSDSAGHLSPHRSKDPDAWLASVWRHRGELERPEVERLGRFHRRARLARIVERRPDETIKARAFKLRDMARVAHPVSRCADCGEILHGLPALMKRPDGGHTMSGVVTCANVWACPVCAMRIKGRRADGIKEAVGALRMHYGANSLLMMTLTASHKSDTDLSVYRQGFSEAAGRALSSRVQRKLGIVAYAYGAEVTHGFNGWHYHRHYILAFDRNLKPQELEALKWELFERWRDKVAQFMGPSHVPSFEHGLDLRPLNLVDYISKLGLELADVGAKKAKNGNSTPWGLLYQTATGHGGALDLFAEYARSMKGAKSVQYSDSLLTLLERLGVTYETDEQAADETIGAALVCEIPIYFWHHVRNRGQLLSLLTRADEGDFPIALCLDGWGSQKQVEREAIANGPFNVRRLEKPSERRERIKDERQRWAASVDASPGATAKAALPCDDMIPEERLWHYLQFVRNHERKKKDGNGQTIDRRDGH